MSCLLVFIAGVASALVVAAGIFFWVFKDFGAYR